MAHGAVLGFRIPIITRGAVQWVVSTSEREAQLVIVPQQQLVLHHLGAPLSSATAAAMEDVVRFDASNKHKLFVILSCRIFRRLFLVIQ